MVCPLLQYPHYLYAACRRADSGVYLFSTESGAWSASLRQTGLYGQEHFMDAIFEWVYIIAGINLLYVLFARAVSFILGLFIKKFRFFLASVFATWIVIILLIFLLRNSTIFNSFFAYILFPSICMLILYFLGKLSNTSFSRGEYIYIFILYILSQYVLLFDFVLIFFGKWMFPYNIL